MAAVVQAKCPHCHKVLRIPSAWLNRQMRCKHCGQTIQPSKPAAGVRAATPPPPPARNVPVGYNHPPLPQAAVPAVAEPVPAKRTPAPPQPKPAAVPNASPIKSAVPPPAPSGIPVAPVVAAPPPASPSDGLFGDLGASEPVRSPRGRRRRQKGGNWMPLVLVLLVLATGIAVGVYFSWPTIGAAFNGGTKAVAENSKTKGEETSGRTTIKDSGRNTDPGKKGDPGKTVDNPGDKTAYPRRAMIVSVHNYLYANPTHAGMPGGGRNVTNLKAALTKGLKIPNNQILHVSDIAPAGKERPPLRSLIQDSVTAFLTSCRAQDRILLFFVGHGTEIENEVYVMPIEGELENKATAIPLKWFYDQLEKCKARQKVFVVDVARYSPTEGRERPGGDPLSAKFEAVLKAPPPGVQVWSACSAEQQSYETDEYPMGLFLGALYDALAPLKPGGGYQGKIQRPNDPFPLEALATLVNKDMEADLKPLKLQPKEVQVCKLYGTEKDNGAEYNPGEPLATLPPLPKPPDMTANPKSVQLVKSVLDEIGTPAVKVSRLDNSLHFEMLPPFPEAGLAQYAATPPPEGSTLRMAVMKARATLWAVAAESKRLPEPLNSEVNKIKADLGVNLTVLRDGYRAPTNEKQFKDGVISDERKVAKILVELMDAEEELMKAGETRDKECKRWQANYDFTLARLQAQIAYLFEYQSMLGSIRKEYPPREPGQSGWKLASQKKLIGDTNGKRHAKKSGETYEKMLTDYAGTPWEILAKREKLTALGLDWKGTK